MAAKKPRRRGVHTVGPGREIYVAQTALAPELVRWCQLQSAIRFRSRNDLIVDALIGYRRRRERGELSPPRKTDAAHPKAKRMTIRMPIELGQWLRLEMATHDLPLRDVFAAALLLYRAETEGR